MPRPFVLDPLFRSLTVLSGVGPKNIRLFENLLGNGRVLDLLWHKPIDFLDRRYKPTILQAQEGRIVTIIVLIQKHNAPTRRGLPYRIWATDETGGLSLVFFNPRKEWLEKQYPEGASVTVSGRLENFNGIKQIIHPDSVLLSASGEPQSPLEEIEPLYPLTAGLTNKSVRKSVLGAIKLLPHGLEEWLDPEWVRRQSWPPWAEAVRKLHIPESEKDILPDTPHRRRLAYDEFLANQLALALVRQQQKKINGRSWACCGQRREKLLKALPFTLTNAQKRALGDIDSDMRENSRMLRLLQGDVGSGKTIVAALAMLNVIDSGAQAAIMAPTEILARQHAQSFTPWLEAAGISFVTLTGRDKGSIRKEVLEKISSGEAQVVIGTHALFQSSVDFHNLGLAVIDEQHRFGVHQRLMLSNKGRGCDILVMTATPIPRTLALTAYGDMEVSRLDEKPAGRKPIDTRLIPTEKVEGMIEGLGRQMETGAQAYWVCPLVEESEKVDLQAATARFETLKERFGERVGLVHGRMKPEEKDAIMTAFSHGEIRLLVATTVIEVGVNVPRATLMIIEQAERFGLAQLHQLRGRVGRGRDQSFCFLLYEEKLSSTARERLKIMRDTEDGFLIAEKDLELRGSGEILGTKQSGLPTFKVADIMAHGDLLAAARDDTKLLLNKDPNLESPRGKALKTLLYLFEQDQAIANLRAG